MRAQVQHLDERLQLEYTPPGLGPITGVGWNRNIETMNLVPTNNPHLVDVKVPDFMRDAVEVLEGRLKEFERLAENREGGIAFQRGRNSDDWTSASTLTELRAMRTYLDGQGNVVDVVASDPKRLSALDKKQTESDPKKQGDPKKQRDKIGTEEGPKPPQPWTSGEKVS